MKQTVRYVALGDSLTEGFGVPADKSFPALYSTMMERAVGRPIQVYRAGVTGETTEEILYRLTTDIDLQRAIGTAHILSLTAGGNDLLQAARLFLAKRDPQLLKAALREFTLNIRGLLDTIERIRLQSADQSGREPVDRLLVMRICNLYNPFPVIEETGYWVNRFNREWRPYETSFVRIVNLHDAFQYRTDELIGEDMVHPNEQGYRLMAEAADAIGYDGLSRASK